MTSKRTNGPWATRLILVLATLDIVLGPKNRNSWTEATFASIHLSVSRALISLTAFRTSWTRCPLQYSEVIGPDLTPAKDGTCASSNNPASTPASPKWFEMGPKDTGTRQSSPLVPSRSGSSPGSLFPPYYPHTCVFTCLLNVALSELHARPGQMFHVSSLDSSYPTTAPFLLMHLHQTFRCRGETDSKCLSSLSPQARYNPLCSPSSLPCSLPLRACSPRPCLLIHLM